MPKPTSGRWNPTTCQTSECIEIFKPPNKQTVTKEERQAIKDLKKADDIIILPADKGKSTVILDKNEYDENVNNMLAWHLYFFYDLCIVL